MAEINILLVEDEQIVAKYIEKQLTGAGYRIVDSVTSGDKAIEKVAALEPDIVLMDIKIMGSMDGIETADYIRKNHQIPACSIHPVPSGRHSPHLRKYPNM